MTVVFSRDPWMPTAIREGGDLRLRVVGGADANHDPREFTIPLTEAQLEVIEHDLERHLLLWSAFLPLCYDAGIKGPLNTRAATALLDPILFGTPHEIDALFRRIPWDKRQLVAQGADIPLLERGKVSDAVQTATQYSDWDRMWEYDADQRRAERGVTLGPLDAALLRYTGRYAQGGKTPARHSSAVAPELLPQVLEVIAVAERATAGMPMSPGWEAGEQGERRRREWNRIKESARAAVRAAYPELVDDAVETVSFLLCSEAHDFADALAQADGDV
ncbi:hypothetical protein C6401_06645 [Arthrobacter woluwensis]|uniref:DUF6357 family protein n=1 Tax=Arthrobacter woluwensis TaxID=156980 RepID=UPI000D125A2D|nr:DUF6357 family protein [Arthrobacter woluwensis]PSS44909.1 hypothetical protein C6401_06645 [Arthrobacter woluwensis]